MTAAYYHLFGALAGWAVLLLLEYVLLPYSYAVLGLRKIITED